MGLIYTPGEVEPIHIELRYVKPHLLPKLLKLSTTSFCPELCDYNIS